MTCKEEQEFEEKWKTEKIWGSAVTESAKTALIRNRVGELTATIQVAVRGTEGV